MKNKLVDLFGSGNEEILKDLNKEITATTQTAAIDRHNIPCAELLEYIVKNVAKSGRCVDDELKKEGIEKPSRAQRVGKFINILLEISAESGHPLEMLNGQPSYYNGKFWEPMPDRKLKFFFNVAARALGVEEYEAMYCDFLKKAQETFLTASHKITKGAGENFGLLNCQNGTLTIKKNGEVELKQHDPEDGLLYVLPYSFDPDAKAPKWESFLNEVLPQAADRHNLAEYCGSIFTDIKHEKIAYLYGATGRNGKTTTKEIICAALGASNVSNVSLSDLTDKGGTGQACRAEIEGKLLNACGETEHKIESSSILKTIATREPITVRPPYQPARTISNYARLMFCCNDLPIFTQGAAKAESRRFLFLEYTEEIPLEKVIQDLDRKIIREELPGVLNWMINGLRRLIDNGGSFTPNAHADAVQSQFLEGSNSVIAYLNEYRLKADTYENRQKYAKHYEREEIKRAELYNNAGRGEYLNGERLSYCAYCSTTGRKPMSKTAFFRVLQSFGIKSQHHKEGDFLHFLAVDYEAIEAEREGGRLEL